MPTNPFKEFMRLIPASAGLLHTIISVAALHKAQRQHALPDIDLSPTSQQNLLTVSTPIPEFYDALSYKQQALYHLRKEFLNPNVSNHDGAIASILMFIWLELMDSGRDSWKYHLTALRGIVQATLVPTIASGGGFTSTFWSSCEYFEMIFAKYVCLFHSSYALYERISADKPVMKFWAQHSSSPHNPTSRSSPQCQRWIS